MKKEIRTTIILMIDKSNTYTLATSNTYNVYLKPAQMIHVSIYLTTSILYPKLLML